MRQWLLYIGGAISMICAVLHMRFWITFHWAEELNRLSPVNKGIMQLLNIMVIYSLVFGGVLALVLARTHRPFSVMEKISTIFVAGIFILRVMLGPPLFGYSTDELIVWIFCLTAGLCYLSPLIGWLRRQNRLSGASRKMRL